MAIFTMGFMSSQLGQKVTVNLVIPDNAHQPVKTLWLLHGLSDDENTWGEQTAIGRYAADLGIAVVMPCCERGWYTDTAYGKNYFTFVTQELVAVCRKHFSLLSHKREDNMVAGNSMGGYGALKAALTYPETFGYCGALSGSVDITRKNMSYDLQEWRSIFGFGLTAATDLAGSSHDLFALAAKLKQEQKEFPKLYLWCGTEDGLIHANREFSRHLQELGIPHQFEESQGGHAWRDWDQQIVDVIRFFLKG